jgi:hypothetical protein
MRSAECCDSSSICEETDSSRSSRVLETSYNASNLMPVGSYDG